MNIRQLNEAIDRVISERPKKCINEFNSSKEPNNVGEAALLGLELPDLLHLAVELLDKNSFFEDAINLLLPYASDYNKEEFGNFLAETITDEYPEKEIIDMLIDKGLAEYETFYGDEYANEE